MLHKSVLEFSQQWGENFSILLSQQEDVEDSILLHSSTSGNHSAVLSL